VTNSRFWVGQPVVLAASLALGVVLGLVYAWLIAPVHYVDTAPDRLRTDLKEEYIVLASEAFAADGDWPALEQRLGALHEPDWAGSVRTLAGKAIAEGRPVGVVRSLAVVAQRLGLEDPAFAPFAPLPSPTVKATSTPGALASQPSPTPPRLPSASATAWPTSTAPPPPRPTATPGVNYRLVTQQGICDPDRPEPLLQVVVRDSQGNHLPGVQVLVGWDGGSSRLHTGLKPELGWGYADLVMQADHVYQVRLAAGSEIVNGISASPCNSRAGERLLSIRLIFERIR